MLKIHTISRVTMISLGIVHTKPLGAPVNIPMASPMLRTLAIGIPSLGEGEMPSLLEPT